MSYEWLHPINGGFSVYRWVDDYEVEKARGFSKYEDCRDLRQAIPEYLLKKEPEIVPEEVPESVPETVPETVQFICPECGRESTTKAGLMAHMRSHK